MTNYTYSSVVMLRFSDLPKDYNEFKHYLATIIHNRVNKYIQMHNAKLYQNSSIYLTFDFSNGDLHVFIESLKFSHLIDKDSNDTFPITYIYIYQDNTLYTPPKIPDKEHYEQFVKMLYEIAIAMAYIGITDNKWNTIKLLLNTMNKDVWQDYKINCIVNTYYTDPPYFNVIKLAVRLLDNDNGN